MIDAPITVRQLITHTSGIRDIYDLWGLGGTIWYLERLRNREALALLDRQRGLNFTPGSQFLYSNSNYVLLAELIAAVTGEAFHVHAAGFFEALDMTATSVRRRHGVIVPELARAYGSWSGWLEDPAIANLNGDGFVFSTLSDQLRWERQIQGREQTLDADLIAHSQAPVAGLENGEYGFGLQHGDYRGFDTVFHVGSTGGYNAYVLRIPAAELAIVVMSNSTEIGVVALGNGIADEILGIAEEDGSESYPAGPEEIGPEPRLADMVGRYETGAGTIIRLSTEGGELYRNIEGRDPVRMIPEGGNVFAYETFPDLKLVYDAPEDGPARFTLFMASQAPQVAVRLTDAPRDAAYFDGLSGRYLNEETGAEILIRHVGDGRFEQERNGRSRDIELRARDDFRSGGYRMRVRRDDAGSVEGFRLDGNRIRDVEFVREALQP